jgi:TetR/AcrR family transcriptional regulator
MDTLRLVMRRQVPARPGAARALPSKSQRSATPRTIGRPRLQPRLADGDPTDEILAVAVRLFGELGIGDTSMARIASDAGLRQSSLYYYFHSKEEILAALVARANVVPLELIDEIETAGGPPPVRLYRFIRGDVIALCRLPFDINEVHRYAAREPERFGDYWAERRILRRRISQIVREGMLDGSFRQVDASLTALTVMSNDEAVQNWYRVEPSRQRTPAAAGVFVADLSVGGLLASGRRLDTVRRHADELDAVLR